MAQEVGFFGGKQSRRPIYIINPELAAFDY